MQQTRLTAKKVIISEIIKGKFIKKTGFESSYVLTRLGRRLSRVRVLGVIVDKFLSPDEKYASITIDDSTDTVRCKSFVNVKIFDGLVPGDLVDVFGKLREYNEEVYLMPEIVRKVSANFETMRLLETKQILDKQRKNVENLLELKSKVSNLEDLKRVAVGIDDVDGILEAQQFVEEEKSAEGKIQEKILSMISQLDKGDGVEYEILLKDSGLKETEVDLSIQELLESGVCFEPKPGRVKKL